MSQPNEDPEFIIPNKDHLAVGKFNATWSGYIIRISRLIAFSAPKKARGINVPVTLIVTKETIEVYV